MASDSPEQRTGFLDLSAELCNRIYDLALHSSRPGPLRLVTLTRDDRKQKGRFRSFRVFAGEAQQLSPNILATCRQIHVEATPVLYGSNVIAFTWSQRFWLQYIGNSTEFLREIETDFKGVDALTEIAKLGALQTVAVRLDYSSISVQGLQVLIPLFFTLRANRKRERLRIGLRDMFLFVSGLSRADKRHEDRVFGLLEDMLL